jgi:hypothetical protein
MIGLTIGLAICVMIGLMLILRLLEVQDAG